jgi:hypothetical protein
MKGFRLNSAYRLPIQGSSAGFAPRGHLFSHVRLNRVPEYVQEKNKIHGCKHEKIIAVQAQKSEVLYLLPISNIPNTI